MDNRCRQKWGVRSDSAVAISSCPSFFDRVNSRMSPSDVRILAGAGRAKGTSQAQIQNADGCNVKPPGGTARADSQA